MVFRGVHGVHGVHGVSRCIEVYRVPPLYNAEQYITVQHGLEIYMGERENHSDFFAVPHSISIPSICNEPHSL